EKKRLSPRSRDPDVAESERAATHCSDHVHVAARLEVFDRPRQSGWGKPGRLLQSLGFNVLVDLVDVPGAFSGVLRRSEYGQNAEGMILDLGHRGSVRWRAEELRGFT